MANFAVSILAILDLVLGDHEEFATVVLHQKRKLGPFLNRPHRVHDLRVGELDGSLGERLDVEVGARKLDAFHIPAILVQQFIGQDRRDVIERNRRWMAKLDL